MSDVNDREDDQFGEALSEVANALQTAGLLASLQRRHAGDLAQNAIKLETAIERAIADKTIIRTWPVRNDPVIRNRLTMMTQDERYSPIMRQTAQSILSETIDETELIAVGVAD